MSEQIPLPNEKSRRKLASVDWQVAIGSNNPTCCDWFQITLASLISTPTPGSFPALWSRELLRFELRESAVSRVIAAFQLLEGNWASLRHCGFDLALPRRSPKHHGNGEMLFHCRSRMHPDHCGESCKHETPHAVETARDRGITYIKVTMSSVDTNFQTSSRISPHPSS